MINHDDFENTIEGKKKLYSLIRQQRIILGGNKKLKIYGFLHCASGKRMQTTNRVFFESETEAINNNFRPCGHCMKDKYRVWKENNR